MKDSLVFDHYPLPKGVLPAGWALVSIGQIARLIASGFPSGQHNQDARGVPHIRPMNIDRGGRLDLSLLKYVEGEIPRELRKGDVLFNNTNSPELIGKTTAVMVDARLTYSNHMTRVRLEDGLNPTFVARQLHFLWMCGYFRHRCVNHVNQASISADPLSETVPILLPPAGEQGRIADALDDLLSDLDAGVAALERVRDKLKLYRASVLKAAVEGALTAEWREQHPHAEPASELLKRILAERRRRWEDEQLRKFEEKGREPPKDWKAKYEVPAAPKTGDLASLPKGWCWVSLDQVFRVERGRFSVRPRNDPHYYGGSIPFVQIGELPREGGRIRTYTQTLNEAGLAVSKKFEAGTVLIAIVGATIGNTGVLNFDSCCPDSLVALQSNSTILLRFAELFLQTRKLALRVAASASGGQPNINLEVLQPLAIPLVSAEEIEAIVDAADEQLSIIDRLESDLDAKLTSAQALRQSLLRHAFTGKLVPQDPNDEPASELLKRIVTERAQRAREAAAAKRLNAQKPPLKLRGKAARTATKGPQHGRIADR